MDRAEMSLFDWLRPCRGSAVGVPVAGQRYVSAAGQAPQGRRRSRAVSTRSTRRTPRRRSRAELSSAGILAEKRLVQREGAAGDRLPRVLAGGQLACAFGQRGERRAVAEQLRERGVQR